MNNEEIIALALGSRLFDDDQNGAYADNLIDYTNAVIKQHEANLLEGVGEPAYKCAPYSNVPNQQVSEPIDYYTATQVAAAVAKAKEPLEKNALAYRDVAVEQKDYITTLESTLKLALEVLESAAAIKLADGTYFDKDCSVTMVITRCKEVLHATK